MLLCAGNPLVTCGSPHKKGLRCDRCAHFRSGHHHSKEWWITRQYSISFKPIDVTGWALFQGHTDSIPLAIAACGETKPRAPPGLSVHRPVLVDSFRVSLDSAIGGQLAAMRVVQMTVNGLCKTVGITNGHITPQRDNPTCI